MNRVRILILAGAGESFELAEALGKDPRCEPVFSLAGVTRTPRLPSIRCRSGGFGGVAGLIRYLEQEGTRLLISATHPFAAQIRRNAVEAARRARCPLLILERPGWTAQSGDRWVRVPDMSRAAVSLGAVPRRVFLTIGRKELAPFAAQPQHTYLIRTIEPPAREHLPPRAQLLTARGPFTEAAERELLISHGIELMVTKDSGGVATDAKLHAARACGVPVVMVQRPPMPPLADVDAHVVGTVEDALRSLQRRHQDLFSTQRVV